MTLYRYRARDVLAGYDHGDPDCAAVTVAHGIPAFEAGSARNPPDATLVADPVRQALANWVALR